MFYLPKDTVEGVWMEASDSNPSGYKWWIAARGQQLFTLWGKGNLDQGKLLDTTSTVDAEEKFRDKITEKKVKGYSHIAFFQKLGWQPLANCTLPDYPPILLSPMTVKPHTEGLVLTVTLYDGFKDYVTLRLGEISGPPAGTKTSGTFRLNHHETVGKSAGGMEFPLWQTRYDSEEEAVDAIRDVIFRKESNGYTLSTVTGSDRVKDAVLSGASPGTVSTAPTNIIIGENPAAPAVWFW